MIPRALQSTLCRMSKWIPLTGAATAVVVATFAGVFGLDPDSKWGAIRLLTLAGGLFVLASAAVSRLIAALDRQLLKRDGRETSSGAKPQAEGVLSDQVEARRFRLGESAVFVVLLLLLYLEIATVWNWPSWPQATYRYAALADAFAHGRLALSLEPSPALAELQNPYDPLQRQGIAVASDLSYFDGRYYMYWGPIPAIAGAIWRHMGGSPISDAHIVLVSVSVTTLFTGLIVLHLRHRYFTRSPRWLVVSVLIMVATAHPLLWALNSPSIYMAAIASGQAAFMGGLYFMLSGLASASTARRRFYSCGALWALAIGCRLTLLIPISTMIVVLVGLKANMQKVGESQRQMRAGLLGVVIPLVVGLALLATYNFARFGHPLESGFSYQLVENDQGEAFRQGLIFNIRYALPNLLHYLTTPIRLVAEFPFVRPWWNAYPPFSSFLARFEIPAEHSVQDAAGLIFVTPGLLLAIPLLRNVFSCNGRRRRESIEKSSTKAVLPSLQQPLALLLLSGTALAGPLLLYRVSSIRFLMEITPTLVVLAGAGAFALHESGRGLPLRRPLANMLIIVVVLLSVVIGFLLALSGADSRFDDANPGLYRFLVELFTP